VDIVRGPSSRIVHGTVGETVSLLPVGGPATGVVASGVQYALHGETLSATASRGVSNVFTETEMHLRVEGGALLVIRPEAL
jgi:thiamine pyrophosphokinase